jgi:transposase-like protein
MSRKRRSYSPQFKVEAVMESLLGQKSNAEICRERDIKESLLYKWKQEFLEQAPPLFEDKRGKQVDSQVAEQAAQIADLERMVGRLTMEVDILKKADSWLSQHRRRNGQ